MDDTTLAANVARLIIFDPAIIAALKDASKTRTKWMVEDLIEAAGLLRSTY